MNSWTIGKRLYGCFGTLLLLLLILGYSAISSISSMTSDLERVVIRTANARYQSARVLESVTEMMSTERGTLTRAVAKDTAGVVEFQNRFTSELGAATKRLTDIGVLIQNPEARKIIENIHS